MCLKCQKKIGRKFVMLCKKAKNTEGKEVAQNLLRHPLETYIYKTLTEHHITIVEKTLALTAKYIYRPGKVLLSKDDIKYIHFKLSELKYVLQQNAAYFLSTKRNIWQTSAVNL